MTHPKGFIHVVVAITILVIAATMVGAAFYFNAHGGTLKATGTVISNFDQCAAAGYPVFDSYPRQCQVNGVTFTEVITAVNENTNAATEETAGWKTYTNTEKKFSLRYPSESSISEADDVNLVGSPRSVTQISDRKDGREFRIWYISLSANQFIEEYNGDEDTVSQVTKPKETAILDGVTVDKVVAETAIGLDSTYYFVDTNSVQFAIEFNANIADHVAILSTLQFLDDPAGWETSASTTLMVAYSDDDDSNIKHLKKVDAVTGKVVQESTLEMKDREISETPNASHGASYSIQFSPNGESLMFQAEEQPGMISGLTYSALYVTTFDNPNNWRLLVDYDNTNKDALTFVDQWVYDATHSRAIFIETTSSTNSQGGSILKSVNTVDGSVSKIRDLDKTRWILNIENDIVVLQKYEDGGKSITLEYVDISSGEIVDTKKGYENRTSAEYVRNSLSPNKQIFTFQIGSSGSRVFHDLSNDTYTEESDLGIIKNHNVVWSPDSSYLFTVMRDGGKVLKISDGSIHIVPDVNYPFIWAPGRYVIYQITANSELYRYDIEAKESKKLQVGSRHSGNYVGMSWVE